MNVGKLEERSAGRSIRLALVLATACLWMSSTWAAPLNLAQAPASLSSQNIAPNLIYLLDDSGSMQFEYIGTTGNIESYYYGYPVGNSNLYGNSSSPHTYTQDATSIAPFPAIPFSVSSADGAQYRSVDINPVYYNPATTYTPWACAGPYPETSTGSGYTVPFTSIPAGVTCHWDSNVNQWLMSDANPNKVYLNPSEQSAGYRSVNVWNDATGNTNNTANNGYDGYVAANNNNPATQIQTAITAVKGSNTLALTQNGFWPAVYANFVSGSNSSIGSYQYVQICPPASAPTTNSNGVASNLTVTFNQTTGNNKGIYTAPSALCAPPPALPGTPLAKHTYLDASGNYVYVDASGKQTVRTYAQEMQNFANWYQYYRSHNLMALAGSSQAFMDLPIDFRVDFATINAITSNGANDTGTPGYSVTTAFDTQQRQDFLRKLFEQPVPVESTPSRLALSAVGKWLAKTPSSSAPWGMSAAEAAANPGLNYLSCRQNYTVFVTDGDWNGNGPSVGNQDGTAGATIQGPSSQSYTYSAASPFKDTYSNTLADVAMYYWKNDLQPVAGNLDNNVPTNSQDPGFWQHMDTFAVGLGVQGSLPFPGALAGLQSGATAWPNPTNGAAQRIDDLWHAGIDGHGGYLSASDPATFSSSLSSTLVSIVNATQASSAVSLNTQQAGQVQTSTQAYLASYHPSTWWGELMADPLVVNGSGNLKIGSPANWNASCVLTGGPCPAMGTNAQGVANVTITVQAPANRSILTWNGSQGIPFEWANLASAQQTSLNGSDGLGSVRLDYLRGGRSNEGTSTNSLRVRSSVLGDIVDSSPVWIGPPSSSFPNSWGDQLYSTMSPAENASGAQTYGTFKSAQATRTHVVYVGANDGLLHGFRSGEYNSSGAYVTTNNDGHEVLAYMPNQALLQINTYTDQNYTHQYFVDATPGAGDLFYGAQWRTWLAGGLGGGGKSLFVLDITNPANFSEANASSLVIKEVSNTSLACANVSNCGNDQGYVYGTPIVRRMHDGNWAVIWGNGYNSQNGTAAVFIADINSTSGAWTVYELNTGYGAGNDPTGQSRPDGIAYVSSGDLDGDHVVDYLYAGDLFGNVWRFDVTSSTPTGTTNWHVSKFGAGTAQPLYSAVNGSGTAQPITTSVQVLSIPQPTGAPSVVLEFGTGKLLEPNDQTPNSSTQTIYGVWDWDMTHWNSLSGVQYAALTAPQTIARAGLTQQTVTGSYDASGNTYNGTGTGYRTLSNNKVCWKGSTGCGASASANTKYGWYLDLPTTGEEVVYNPTIAFGVFIVNTYIPSNVSKLTCSTQTSSGFTMALNPSTGGAMQNSFFGNSSGNFVTIQGQVVSGLAQNAVGTPSFVTYGSQNQPAMITQTAGGTGNLVNVNPGAGSVGGRATWVQLR